MKKEKETENERHAVEKAPDRVVLVRDYLVNSKAGCCWGK